LWSLPSNKGLDSTHKEVLLLRLLFFQFDIDFFGSELHKGNITKLMNVIN